LPLFDFATDTQLADGALDTVKCLVTPVAVLVGASTWNITIPDRAHFIGQIVNRLS
jgi:hypothetical protein